MSIQDERDLRGRLGGLLNSVEPVPAPVARAMQRGKVIRMRRWVAGAVGVAVIAAGAVVLPRVIAGHHAAAPIAPRHYNVTVQDIGPTAKGGVIAAGTINHKRWSVVLDRRMGDGCSPMPQRLMCGLMYYGGDMAPRDVSLDSAGAGGTQFQLGIVGSDVTRVVVRLSNGISLDLRPVSAYGRRWVAVAAPLRTMVEAESFVGKSEYQHAVPWVTATDTEFVTWLRPGQPGLPRVSARVGAGNVDGVAWQTSVSVGPWGYCAAFANGGDCVPTTRSLQPQGIGKPLLATCGPLYNVSGKQVAASGVVVLPAGVKNLVLEFSDGSHTRLVAASVAGTRAIGFGLPKRPSVVRAMEYGFRGQLLGSTLADWWC
jgi:hypothetical protein